MPVTYDFLPSRSRFRNVFDPHLGSDTSNLTGTSPDGSQLTSSPRPYRRQVFDEPQLNPRDFTPDPRSEDEKTADELMNFYNKPSPATARLNEYIATQPSEKDYKPSGKRRALAALAGFGAGMTSPEAGARVGREIADKPFNEALSDWTRKGKPLEYAAQSEEKNRTTQLAALKDYMQARHNIIMDNSLNDSRKSEALARIALQHHQQVLEWQANQNAMGLENDRKQREADRIADNKRKDAENAALEIQRARERQHMGSQEATDAARTRIMQQNADTSSKRADEYVKNAGVYRNHVGFLEQNFPKSGPPATQQSAAETLARHKVMSVPGNAKKYDDYVVKDNYGRITADNPPKPGFFTSDEAYQQELAVYNQYRREVDAESAKILQTYKPTGRGSGVKKVEEIPIPK